MRNLCLVLLAASCGAAHAEGANVQVYGRLNVGLESLSNDDARVTRLSNYRSVLGFRGSEDLGGGLKAIFQIEGTLAPDTVTYRGYRLTLAHV
jgi:predicted porin